MKKMCKPQDERIVAEKNRIYKIGFYVFTVGIAADFLLSAKDFHRVEWLTFMAAQLACIILSARRGIYTEDARAETFRLKRHVLQLGAVGAVTGALLFARNMAVLGYAERMTAGACAAAGLLMIACVTMCTLLLGLPLSYGAFYAAKRRREAQLCGDDAEE